MTAYPAVSYDDSSCDYQKYWRRRVYEDLAEKNSLGKLFRLIPSREAIADVGAGFGRLTPVYAPLFDHCFLIDPSQGLLKKAHKLTRKYKNLSFVKATAENLPLRPKSVDVILCIRTFHHLKDPQLVIKQFHRVLKNGGFLILEFANKIHLKSVIKAISSHNLSFLLSHVPQNISTNKRVPFFNYHPTHVKSLLLINGFKIIKTVSVSNFRHPLIKKLIPLKILLSLEAGLSAASSYFSPLTFLGPSIFVLAKKKNDPGSSPS